MSADLLRRAAAKLREHVEDASIGPWVAAEDGLVWPPRMGDPVSGSSAIEDARYIALMHPDVARAVADLLDVIADCVVVSYAAGEPTLRAPRAAAVATAQAVLREPEVTS